MALFSVVIENRLVGARGPVIPRVFDCEARAFEFVLEYTIEQMELHHFTMMDFLDELPSEVSEIYRNSQGIQSIGEKIKQLDSDVQKGLIDWVFNHLDDEDAVVYYRIDEQVLDNDSGLITLTDCLVRDWRYSEDLKEDIPESCRDYYRLTVEQAQETGQLYIRLYPYILDEVSNELPEHGLGLCVEVQDGLPALSMGLNTHDLDIQVKSDLNANIAIENTVTGTGMEMKLGNGDWLTQARAEVAELTYDKQIWNIEGFIEDSGAEFDGDRYTRTFFQNRPDTPNSVAYQFHCTFLGNTLAHDWGYKAK